MLGNEDKEKSTDKVRTEYNRIQQQKSAPGMDVCLLCFVPYRKRPLQRADYLSNETYPVCVGRVW